MIGTEIGPDAVADDDYDALDLSGLLERIAAALTEEDDYRIDTGPDDDDFCTLVGPAAFVCRLGEPEDRSWLRDGSEAVARLNEQHRDLDRARAEIARLRDCLGWLDRGGGLGADTHRRIRDCLDATITKLTKEDDHALGTRIGAGPADGLSGGGAPTAPR